MLAILSSASREKYKKDILRCISTPIGGRVQFRYSNEWVESEIWNYPERFNSKEGIIFSVNLNITNLPCTLIPIRKVKVEKILKHGSTLSVFLIVQDFAFCQNCDNLTEEIDKTIPRLIPKKGYINGIKTPLSGKFLFNFHCSSHDIKFSNKLTTWENMVSLIYQQDDYRNVPHFWIVVGILEKWPIDYTTIDSCFKWPRKIDISKPLCLLLHVFHPDRESWLKRDNKLLVSSNLSLTFGISNVITLDNPYDLKIARFNVDSYKNQIYDNIWLKLDFVTDDFSDQIVNNTSHWQIDIESTIKRSKILFILVLVIIGFCISFPAIINIFLQKNVSTNFKIVAGILYLISGIIAAFLAKTGIKKPL